jgi:hypothetical protein
MPMSFEVCGSEEIKKNGTDTLEYEYVISDPNDAGTEIDELTLLEIFTVDSINCGELTFAVV